MRPVAYSISPDNAFYKRTPLEWADYFELAHFICDAENAPMTRAEFKRRFKEQL